MHSKAVAVAAGTTAAEVVVVKAAVSSAIARRITTATAIASTAEAAINNIRSINTATAAVVSAAASPTCAAVASMEITVCILSRSDNVRAGRRDQMQQQHMAPRSRFTGVLGSRTLAPDEVVTSSSQADTLGSATPAAASDSATTDVSSASAGRPKLNLTKRKEQPASAVDQLAEGVQRSKIFGNAKPAEFSKQ